MWFNAINWIIQLFNIWHLRDGQSGFIKINDQWIYRGDKLFWQHSLFLSAYWFSSSSHRSIKSIKINLVGNYLFKIDQYSYLKSSQDNAEFEAWLEEKQRLNRNIKKVCRERNVQSRIGGMSFMYILPTNILFCLNQKVTQNNFKREFDQWPEI